VWDSHTNLHEEAVGCQQRTISSIDDVVALVPGTRIRAAWTRIVAADRAFADRASSRSSGHPKQAPDT
jgi:hypothetical protein